MTHQMMSIANFTSDLRILAGIHKWNPNRATELSAIATALGTDTTLHSTEMQTAPTGLKPGLAANTKFTNDVLLIVNNGKAGNLTNAAMGSAITSGLAQILPPANTAAPVVSSPGLSVAGNNTATTTNGTWSYSPTEYEYQWLRGGSPIFGATAQTHLLVAADVGFNLSCMVIAINASGSTSKASNTIGPVTA
jgi:hypothetical protein